MNALAGQTAAGRRGFRRRLRGQRTGRLLDARDVAKLEQHEAFFGLLTVRETLLTAAELQPTEAESAMARGEAAEARAARVDTLLQTLGLGALSDARVGDAGHEGISGGVRRRLAVRSMQSGHATHQ